MLNERQEKLVKELKNFCETLNKSEESQGNFLDLGALRNSVSNVESAKKELIEYNSKIYKETYEHFRTTVEPLRDDLNKLGFATTLKVSDSLDAPLKCSNLNPTIRLNIYNYNDIIFDIEAKLVTRTEFCENINIGWKISEVYFKSNGSVNENLTIAIQNSKYSLETALREALVRRNTSNKKITTL